MRWNIGVELGYRRSIEENSCVLIHRERNSLVSKPESEEEHLGVYKEGILAWWVGERDAGKRNQVGRFETVEGEGVKGV